MRLILLTTLIVCALGFALSQDCPCSKEIERACRNPWDGPDFDNDKNWEYAGLVDFMDEKQLAELPSREPRTQRHESRPYDPERHRPVAISPEGKKYIWRGPLPGNDTGLDWDEAHYGRDIPILPPTSVLPEEGGACFPFSEQRDGRVTIEGNGRQLYSSDDFVVLSAPYTSSGGIASTFPPGGVEMVSGVMRLHHAALFRVLNPTTVAVVVTGLSAIDNLVVNMQLQTTGGVQSPLYVGSFPANFDTASGFEVRVLDSFAQSYAFISHQGPIASILLGHVQIATSLCGYDTIPQQWYDLPLAGTTRKGRSVFGTDTRKRDNPTSGYPFRAFGAMHSPTGSVHYCSGTKIGPRHFLTAGHCMFDPDTLKWIPNARIWFGQNGDGTGLPPTATQAPHGITKHSWYYTSVGWLEDQDWDYDYGLIILQDSSATVGLGWFGYTAESVRSEEGKTVHLHGFPKSSLVCAASPRADKKCAGFMYGDHGVIKDRSSTHLYYNIDTQPGNSGSGVYDYNGGNRLVVGVHAYGDDGDGYNKAVRINKEVRDNIHAWKVQWPSQFD